MNSVERTQVATNAEPQLPLRYAPAITVDDAAEAGPKRILVLGATSGIAEATCRLWAERGDHLFLVGRNADRLLLRQRTCACAEPAMSTPRLRTWTIQRSMRSCWPMR